MSETGETSGNPGLESWFKSLKPVINTLYATDGPDLIDRIKPLSLLKPGMLVLKGRQKNGLGMVKIDATMRRRYTHGVGIRSAATCLVGTSIFVWYLYGTTITILHGVALYWALLGDQVVEGDCGQLTRALEQACAALGVTVHTGSEIQGIDTTDGRATSVRVQDTVYEAEQVYSTLGVAAALELFPPTSLPMSSERRLTHIRSRGIMAKLHCAIEGPIPWLEKCLTRIGSIPNR